MIFGVFNINKLVFKQKTVIVLCLLFLLIVSLSVMLCLKIGSRASSLACLLWTKSRGGERSGCFIFNYIFFFDICCSLKHVLLKKGILFHQPGISSHMDMFHVKQKLLIFSSNNCVAT